MAKVTLIFAVLLIALGLGSYFGTGSLHPTALIPTWFGLALGLSPKELGIWTAPGGTKVAWFTDPFGNVLSLQQDA